MQLFARREWPQNNACQTAVNDRPTNALCDDGWERNGGGIMKRVKERRDCINVCKHTTNLDGRGEWKVGLLHSAFILGQIHWPLVPSIHSSNIVHVTVLQSSANAIPFSSCQFVPLPLLLDCVRRIDRFWPNCLQERQQENRSNQGRETSTFASEWQKCGAQIVASSNPVGNNFIRFGQQHLAIVVAHNHTIRNAVTSTKGSKQ